MRRALLSLPFLFATPALAQQVTVPEALAALVRAAPGLQALDFADNALPEGAAVLYVTRLLAELTLATYNPEMETGMEVYCAPYRDTGLQGCRLELRLNYLQPPVNHQAAFLLEATPEAECPEPQAPHLDSFEPFRPCSWRIPDGLIYISRVQDAG